VNEKTGSSLSTQIFEKIPEEVFDITKNRLNNSNNIINNYYSKDNILTDA